MRAICCFASALSSPYSSRACGSTRASIPPSRRELRNDPSSHPVAHVLKIARYPFLRLYRGFGDEALYYATAAQLLGSPYEHDIVAPGKRKRVPAWFDAPPPPADGHWHRPWADVKLEYPPALLPFILAPKLVATGVEVYAHAFGALMGLCMIAAMGLAIGIARSSLPASASLDARWWLGASLLLAQGSLTIQRLDPVVMIAAVHGAVHRKAWQFGLCAGLSCACKVVPLLIVPVVVAADWQYWRSRLTRLAVWTLAGVTIGFGPMFIASPTALFGLLRYHSERGLQVESTLGALYGTARWIAGVATPTTISYGSFNFEGHSSNLLAALTMPLTLVGIGVLVARELRGHPTQDDRERIERVARAALAATIMVWLCGKVLSPQYLAWGIPLTLAIPGRRGVVSIWLFVVALALTQLYFCGYYDFVYQQRFIGLTTLLVPQAVLVHLLLFVIRTTPGGLVYSPRGAALLSESTIG